MTTPLPQAFEQAQARVKALSARPTDEQLLNLYGAFKQATEGDVQGDRPGFFDFKAGAKYAAWENLRGMSEDDAMTRYIQLVDALTDRA
ncbi:acyl-CoA-binding protein [Ferrimonas marina]|uniref:Acyl-CoA-binding protein n=1 Tax=Ferrimonas marina TaxID=299255 RepID=A0A1M5SC37_9GAMM|nr:acyl-CoA-binding protein [Ferrimonas marina]SHH36094.1 Acyl-CoA-binding protein [Ferrimonas marina]